MDPSSPNLPPDNASSAAPQPPGTQTPFLVAVRRDVRVGVRSGMHTFWVLTRAMIPAYLLALMLKELGVIDWLGHEAGPVMSLLGLPGDAAVPLLLAYILNLYAAVGAMQALTLSAQQITVLALAILIGHNLLVEGAVQRRTGMDPFLFGGLRVVAGLACAAVANLIMNAL